jgi:putative ABC transport system permease protein
MSWLQDVRHAARSLRKSPGFTAVAALTLALGVGANTAIFSVVNTVMLRPLPFSNPDRLVRIWESDPEHGRPTFSASHPNFLDWRSEARTFKALAAVTGSTFTLTAGADAESVQGLNVTATFLPALEVTPIVGRNFTPDEDRPGGNVRVAILTEAFWRRAFGGDPGLVGRAITLNSQPHTVIGVLPAGFQWDTNTEVLVPLAPDPARGRGDHRLLVIGRLADGVTVEQSTAELKTIAARLAAQYPASNKGWTIVTAGFYDWLVPEPTRRSLLILLGAVGLVLLIACGNVVNLLLARGAVRQRELAIRSAMGASRLRVTRQLLAELCLIAMAAAAVGGGITFAAMRLLLFLGPDSVPRLDELSIDWVVSGYAMGIALVTMIGFGLVPSIQMSRQDPQDGLRADSRGSTSGAARQRVRAILTVAEVALSVALLIGAGLLIRSFSLVQQVDAGFATAGTMTARISLPNATYPGGTPKWAFFDRLLTDLRGRPGIIAAAISSGPPLTGDTTSGDVRLTTQTNDEAMSTNWRLVSPGYFAALGIPLRGRDFTARDIPEGPRVAIISAALAARYFPNEDPIGRSLVMRSFGNDPQTIIGVVGDVRTFGLESTAGFVFYGSSSQYTNWNPMTLVWRSPNDLATDSSRVDPVRAAIRSLDPSVPLSNVASMDTLIERSFGPRRFNLYLLGAFAAVALALAAIGLFGVMTYLVSQRTREIGVRLALGATRAEVFRVVLGRGVTLAAIGAIAGVGAALWLTRVMESLLFSVSRTDPVTFITVPAGLIAVACLACYVPARRAMRVDPVIALRSE